MAKRQWSRSFRGCRDRGGKRERQLHGFRAPLWGLISSVMVLHRKEQLTSRTSIFREVCGVRLVRTENMGDQKRAEQFYEQSASCSETPPTLARLAAHLFRLASSLRELHRRPQLANSQTTRLLQPGVQEACVERISGAGRIHGLNGKGRLTEQLSFAHGDSNPASQASQQSAVLPFARLAGTLRESGSGLWRGLRLRLGRTGRLLRGFAPSLVPSFRKDHSPDLARW